MAPDAATATTTLALTAATATVLVAVTAGYGWLCWMRPFRRCRACHGRGVRTTAVLHRTRTCRRCRGEGWRLRTGRRLHRHLRSLRHAAHTTDRTPPPSRRTP